MATTLREIAKRSRVSMQTVSSVLNHKSHLYRPETRVKVLEAAAALGYRPNGSAKAMRKGRFGAIALLESTNADLSYKLPGLVSGIQAGLAAEDLQLVLKSMPDQRLTDTESVPRLLRELNADGLLINYTNRVPDKMIELIERFQIPSIWLNVQRRSDSVYFDDFAGAETATSELLTRGHRDIAYVDYHNPPGDPDPHYSVSARKNGYVKAMKDAGLAPRLFVLDEPIQPAERIDLAAKWLCGTDCPTAAVTYSPYTASPLLLAAVMKAGKVVPRDLSIITFAERYFSDMGIPLSAMVLPEFELGNIATQQLLVKVDSPGEPLPPHVLPLTFSIGGSCAPPRGN